MQDVISVSLNLLRLALYPDIWLILDKFEWAAEERVVVPAAAAAATVVLVLFLF